MWARVVEFMLACWLAVSPFVFGYAASDRLYWASDFVSAVLTATFAIASYWRPTRHAHLLTILVALWLIGFGRLGGPSPPPPGMQSAIVVGLLLLMFAIVPNHAERPPDSWRGNPANETSR